MTGPKYDPDLLERFDFTPEEIAEIEAEDETPTPPKEKEMTIQKPLRSGASRAEKLDALPAFPRDARGKSLEKRLAATRDAALTTLTELDQTLDSVADAFEAAFARDDSRAASRDRINSTAKAHREASRRR